MNLPGSSAPARTSQPVRPVADYNRVMHVHVHDHDHDLAFPSTRDIAAVTSRVAWTLALTTALMVVEFIGGWFSGSLALMADAGHMLSDAAALGASWWALRRSMVPASDQRTFGERRSETLAALFNGALLFVVAGGILHEAWERFSEPASIRAGLMLAVSSLGLAANVVGLLLLHRDRNSSLNLEGAWQHVAGDAAGSLCAVGAAIGILLGGARWAILDPIASAAVSILILIGAFRLVRRTVDVLMEHAPRDVDVKQVRETIAATPGVLGVHCLHVWTISANCRAMSAHVAHAAECSPLEMLHELHKRLAHAFRVEHITLQLEPPGFDGCAGHDEWCQIETGH